MRLALALACAIAFAVATEAIFQSPTAGGLAFATCCVALFATRPAPHD